MKVIIYIALCLLLGIMAALALTNTFPFNSGGIGNPTAKDILKGNPDADILKLDGLIYSNVSDREWLDDNRYTKGEKIGEIKKQTTATWWFRNFFATKLPKGTKIFMSNGKEYGEYPPSLVIVEINNEELVYQAMVEG
ncbi:hypothetical protein [Virgibacillus sp. JSM 102003]|uniref:hypothetical protein n=1 Tax=Virgibacillus sp. JSM 102003 TaxID=1562108 RepID=UPI0035C0BA0A